MLHHHVFSEIWVITALAVVAAFGGHLLVNAIVGHWQEKIKRESKNEKLKELYKYKTEIKTGNSPFTKSMKTSIDAVYESVYFNFQIVTELRSNVRKNTVQELAFL